MSEVLITGTYCYAELTVFFPGGGLETIATSTHSIYPRRDGQVELGWVAGYISTQYTCEQSSISLLTQYDVRQLQ